MGSQKFDTRVVGLGTQSNFSYDILYHEDNISSTTANITIVNSAITKRIELYIVIGYLIFFSILGATGNALVMYVFHKKRDKTVSTVFILCLAYVDFCACLIVVPYTIFMEYMHFKCTYDFLCKLYQFLITSNIPFSSFVMVAIAVDRYFCICHPFMHAITPFRARIIIVFMGLLASSLGVITSLIYGVVKTMQVNVPSRVQVHSLANTSDSVVYKHDLSWETLVTSVKPGVADDTYSYTGGASKHKDGSVLTNVTKIMTMFTGICMPNEVLFSKHFQTMYQKIYSAVFFVCLVIVIILYIMIYRSVRMRRKKRQRQKSMRPMPSRPMVDERSAIIPKDTQTTILNSKIVTTALNENDSYVQNGAEGINGKTRKNGKRKSSRKLNIKKENRMANLKTAAMLFVVTVVFIVTYLPALFMALEFVPYSMTVFYMYFANHVANPIIYSFMNRNFRNDLKKLFHCE